MVNAAYRSGCLLSHAVVNQLITTSVIKLPCFANLLYKSSYIRADFSIKVEIVRVDPVRLRYSLNNKSLGKVEFCFCNWTICKSHCSAMQNTISYQALAYCLLLFARHSF